MVWLDNIRILATFSVILLHVSAGVVVKYGVGTEYWWVGNIYDSAVRWCIPLFVMISGALLLDPDRQEEGLITFYKKRLSRIFIPLITWSAFFLIWATFKNPALSTDDLLKRLLSGMPYYHMWFLYMIFGLYLFTPFLQKIVIHSSKKELLYLIGITLIISAFNFVHGQLLSEMPKLFINWFLFFIPYFLLGTYIHQDNHQPSKRLLWGIFILSITLTSLGCYITAISVNLTMGFYFYGYLSITVIPMSISLMYILKSWNNPIFSHSTTKTVSALTLGVYLVHPLILRVIDGMINTHPILSIPLAALVIFIISLGITWGIYQVPYLKRIV